MSELAVGQYVPLAEGVYLEGLAVDHVREIVLYSDVIAPAPRFAVELRGNRSNLGL